MEVPLWLSSKLYRASILSYEVPPVFKFNHNHDRLINLRVKNENLFKFCLSFAQSFDNYKILEDTKKYYFKRIKKILHFIYF